MESKHAYGRELTDNDLWFMDIDDLWELAAECHAPCEPDKCDACRAYTIALCWED